MRALLIGAVEGTRVAMETIAAAPGWELAAFMTLAPTLAHRHSDYVDLRKDAAQLGAKVIAISSGNDPAAVAMVEEAKPDISFVIGWSQICGVALIAAGGGRMVGYHPAPLPRLRGRAAIPWTILLGDTISASTLFWVTPGVDEGPILAQRFFHVAPDETAGSLYAKHMRALRLALEDLLPQLQQGYPSGCPQEHHLATWGARRRPEDGIIDWHRPAADIDRLIRAVGRPYPGAYTLAGNDRIQIWSSRISDLQTRYHALPGQVVACDGDRFSVCCGDGRLLEVLDHDSAAGSPPKMHMVLGLAA